MFSSATSELNVMTIQYYKFSDCSNGVLVNGKETAVESWEKMGQCNMQSDGETSFEWTTSLDNLSAERCTYSVNNCEGSGSCITVTNGGCVPAPEGGIQYSWPLTLGEAVCDCASLQPLVHISESCEEDVLPHGLNAFGECVNNIFGTTGSGQITLSTLDQRYIEYCYWDATGCVGFTQCGDMYRNGACTADYFVYSWDCNCTYPTTGVIRTLGGYQTQPSSDATLGIIPKAVLMVSMVSTFLPL